jgi:hypothetical protein
LTFAVSESVSDFVVGDITVSGGTLSNFSGSGTSYTATFTPTANSTTPGVVSVGSTKFSDAAGNFNVDGSDANNTVSISVNTVPADTTPPTISLVSSKTSLTYGQTATLTFVVSEAVADFVVGDVTVSGGLLSSFSLASGTTYSAVFTPNSNSTVPGIISVSSGKFSDAAGNFNTDGADANNSVTITVNTIPPDTTPPTIAISSDKSALGGGQSATVSFALSEPVSDFTIGDISVSGGLLSNFGGFGANYTATFTTSSNSVTNGLLSVGSGRFSDAAGNFNVDGGDSNNSVSFSIDTVPPTIAITSDKANQKNLHFTYIVVASKMNPQKH